MSDESKTNRELPVGWTRSSINGLAFIVTKGSTPTTYGFPYQKKGIRFVKAENIVDGWIDDETIDEFISQEAYDFLKRSQLKEHDVLFSIAGTIGRTTIVRTIDLPANTNQAIAIIRCTWQYIEPRFIRLILDSPLLFNSFSGKRRGIGMDNISLGDIKDLEIQLPPLNEQKRIVEKIEELFLKLDYTKSTLEKVKLQLIKYQESFLKSLFEGQLTEKWRSENKIDLSLLLKKITIGRKNQDKKLQDIEFDEISAVFTIPAEWIWVRMGIILKNIQYGTSEKASTEKSMIPVLRMGNIQDGELNFNRLKYYPNNWKNFKQFSLDVDDVLFNRTNSAKLVGKTAVYQDHHPVAAFAGYLIRMKVIDKTYNSILLSWFVNSIFGKSYIKTVVTQQVGQANVNATKLSMMPIPLMSFEEQYEMCSQLEMAFSLIKNSKDIVNSMLLQIDSLKLTILKQAFEGKLVPQDPNDESAETLLQKIKQQKEQLKQKQKTKRRSKNVK